MRSLAIALALALLPAAAAAQKAPACSRFPVGEATYVCECGAAPHVGPVWGANPYTSDSDVCAAAQHAGALGPLGGRVVATAVEGGAESFAGTLSHDVQSSSWGAYPTAFAFPARGVAGVETCRRLRPDEASLECQCPPEAERTVGVIWGSGPYTADSDVCTAAVHAGLVGPEGGPVTALAAPGQDAYPGSEANGVASNDWGAYGTSLDFVR